MSEPISRPRSIQRPHPLIVVGGRGEKKTLRLVAKYGDACNFSMFHQGPDLSSAEALAEVGHKLDVLRAHCEAVGRNYDEIERTVLGWLPVRKAPGAGALSAAALEVMRRYAEVGIDHMLIATSTLFPDGLDRDTLAVFREEIIPAAALIATADRV